MAYLINEEDRDLLETVREFAEKEIKEQSKEWEKDGNVPQELYDQMAEMGLYCLEIPEENGGLGISKITAAALYEEIARADSGVAMTILATNLAYTTVKIAGNDEQKQHVADMIMEGKHGAFCLTEPSAGCDASNSKCTAVKDGDDYILNGRKCFITNGSLADWYVITAITDKSVPAAKGMSAFLVEKDKVTGLSSGNHEDKMGIRCSDTCDVVMEDVRVPASAMLGDPGKGYKYAMMTLDVTRTWVGVVATGISQRCIDEAVAYGKQRVTFGVPILKHQALAFKVADMAMRTETARQMCAHSLTLMEVGKPYSQESSIAKAYAGDCAVQNAVEAIQILGGYGYSKEYPVEKLLRDAKIFQIFEGTNEVQRIVIARNTIGKFE
jgi:butyryl-CoA dehydrogenase